MEEAQPGRARRFATASAQAAQTTSRRLATATSRAAKGTARRVRRATYAQGAGESGLGRIIELHAINAAGDALIAIALANTLFFAVPTDEARSQVALYLALTMAPYAVVAPLVGPFLDRTRRGRRWAIGTTTATRAFLCWVMAGAVVDGSLWLYAAALGALVASKAYGITRTAAVPRVLPSQIPLVTANSRVQLAGVVGAAVAIPFGLVLGLAGPDWVLRLGFVVFIIATVLAILLPAQVDSSVGELRASLRSNGNNAGHSLTGTTPDDSDARSGKIKKSAVRRRRVGPRVVRALRANAALRAFSGFLTMYLAFLLRERPVGGLDVAVALGLVVVAAGVGSTTGTSLGATMRAKQPDRLVVALVLLAILSAVAAALLWGVVTALLVALVAGFAQQLGKLSLDAVIQRDVAEAVRTSAFGRSETLLQLAWVLGGALGIVLPLVPRLGLGVAAVGLVAGLIFASRVSPRPPVRPRPMVAPEAPR